jgi:hypothetical protein
MAVNPFDHTGTLDTTGWGLKPTTVFPAAGTTPGSGGVEQGNTADDSICPAFHDATLAADAAARLQQGQFIPSPLAP